MIYVEVPENGQSVRVIAVMINLKSLVTHTNCNSFFPHTVLIITLHSVTNETINAFFFLHKVFQKDKESRIINYNINYN